MKLRVNILDQRRRAAAIGLSAGIGATVLIALLLSLQLVTTAAPGATTWYVHPNGSDSDATPAMGACEWTGQAVYTTTISPGLGGILIYTDTPGLAITVQVPAGAVNYPATLVFTPLLSTTEPTSPNLCFDLHFYWNDQPPSGFTFSRTVTITIHYSDADVRGIFEDSLKLYRWVTPTWEVVGAWPGEAQTLDTVNNVLTAWVRRLGRFKVMGIGRHDIFLPLVNKSGAAR
jgi:hypothetical protein